MAERPNLVSRGHSDDAGAKWFLGIIGIIVLIGIIVFVVVVWAGNSLADSAEDWAADER